MSLQSVREFFLPRDIHVPIVETDVNTATVALAAEAHGVEPGRIAKTLAFRVAEGRVIVLPAAGSVNSIIRITPAPLASVTLGEWVDVC